jgi:1,4-alpha-glucan branching enzyme
MKFPSALAAALLLAASAALAAPLGSTIQSNGVAFRVWAPHADSVSLAGTFNGWTPAPMFGDESGDVWSLVVPSARVGHRYKFVVNGDLWKRDPRARRVNHSSGDSVVYDPSAFDWGDDAPPAIERNDLVLYQLHVGTFAGVPPPATFDQAIPLLDYLVKLGVNAVQLMPVNEFPGSLSWGYNPCDLFAVETDYGGPDALKRFVRAAHRRGLAVFADVVHNHYGPTDLDLWQFDGWHQNDLGGIYFYNDSRAHTPWGSTRPDYTQPDVRQFVRDQILMFADEYRIDGFRWDSVYHLINTEQGPNPQGVDMLRQINQELARTHPRLLRIAEDHAFDHDMAFDAQWDIGHRWALFNQIATAWDHERDMNLVAGTLRDWAGFQRVVFTEAHDYVATMNENRTRVPSLIHPEDPESIWARKRALLGAAVLMTTPGIPMIFQGQEFHETLPFHDDIPLRWQRTKSHRPILLAYADLIRLRRNKSGTTRGLMGVGVHVHHLDNDNKVIAYMRWDKGGQTDDVVVVANFSNLDFDKDDYQIVFPSEGTWIQRFNSDSTRYGTDFGNVGSPRVQAVGSPPSATVKMGRYSLQIFTKSP